MNNKFKAESKSIIDDDRIEKYLKGFMTKSEEDNFVTELKSNKELRERAVIQAKIIKAMQQVDNDIINAFRESNKESLINLLGPIEIAACVSETPKTHTIPVTTKIFGKYRWSVVAASVLIFFFIGFKSYDYYYITNLGKEYAKSFPAYSQVRGENDNETQNELNELFKKIEIGSDLISTISILEQIWKEANSDTYNKYTDYAPYIGWNLAVAYLQNYDKDSAIIVLKQMQEMYPSGTATGNDVNSLIELI